MELLFLNLGTQELILLFIAVPAFVLYLIGMIHCIANEQTPASNSFYGV